MVYNLTECAALFFAYAAMGWFMEVLYMGVRERHLTNAVFCWDLLSDLWSRHAGHHPGCFRAATTAIGTCSSRSFCCAVCWNTQSVPYGTSVPHTLVGLSRYEVQHSRTDLSGNHAAVWTAGHICPLSHQSVSDDAVSPDPRLCFRKLVTGVVVLFLADLVISVCVLRNLSLPDGDADHTAEISRRVWKI